MPGCSVCDRNAAGDHLQVWERVRLDRQWRLALALDASLPGWPVLLPQRHIEGLHELSQDEAGGMGRLLRAASAALVGTTGCQRTYVMLFAEAEGFSLLHLHVVPTTGHQQTILTCASAFATGDLAQILSCVSDDSVWEFNGQQAGQGRAAFEAQMTQDLASGTAEVTIDRFNEQDSVVVALDRGRLVPCGGGEAVPFVSAEVHTSRCHWNPS